MNSGPFLADSGRMGGALRVYMTAQVCLLFHRASSFRPPFDWANFSRQSTCVPEHGHFPIQAFLSVVRLENATRLIVGWQAKPCLASFHVAMSATNSKWPHRNWAIFITRRMNF